MSRESFQFLLESIVPGDICPWRVLFWENFLLESNVRRVIVCLFVCVGPGNSSDGSPIFQGVSSSPRGGVGTSLPGLTGGIPTRAWDRGGKQTFLTPRPVLS